MDCCFFIKDSFLISLMTAEYHNQNNFIFCIGCSFSTAPNLALHVFIVSLCKQWYKCNFAKDNTKRPPDHPSGLFVY